MRSVRREGKFRKDLKRASKRGYELEHLHKVLDLLVGGKPLPAETRLHRLTGEWQGYWECHIKPNWLLIFRVTEDEVILARTGTHSDLLE